MSEVRAHDPVRGWRRRKDTMAALKNQLRSDLTTSMKARDTFRTSVLRMVLSAIQTEEVAGTSARELSEDEERAILGREVRKRKESAELYTTGNRPEPVSYTHLTLP